MTVSRRAILMGLIEPQKSDVSSGLQKAKQVYSSNYTKCTPQREQNREKHKNE